MPPYTPAMLDRGLRSTFRNFATLFFVVAAVVVPLNLVNTYIFRDVERVREVEHQIRGLETETILGVDPQRLDAAGRARTLVLIVELLLIPALLGASRKVLDDDAQRRLPKVSSALAVGGARPRIALLFENPGLSLAALALAGLVWFLVTRIGSVVAEALYDEAAWAGVGLFRGLAVAVAAPFLLGPIADGANGGAGRTGRQSPRVKGAPPGEPTS